MSALRLTLAPLALGGLTLAGPLGSGTTFAQGSRASVQFHGTGAGQDRARFPVDDDAPGADASAPLDVGAGSFTLELWIRGEAHDNETPVLAEGSYADDRWNGGNVLLDRTQVAATTASGARYGVALCGGRVAFYTGAGPAGSPDAEDTSLGDRDVLDGAWHHVAIVRDASAGTKRIFVDGLLDHESPAGTSTADLSYPDDGLGGTGAWDPWLVLGAAKYDTAPAFEGWVDELRVWSRARSPAEILGAQRRRMHPHQDGLAAEWRLEEGFGTVLRDTSGNASPQGTLVAGVAGNGTWIDAEIQPGDVAPIESSLPLGFVEERLFAVPEIVALEFAPDGTLYAGEKTGFIWSWSGAGAPALVIAVPAEPTGERGLLGLAFDPQFASTGWMYAFYTIAPPSQPARNRVSRFTLVNGVAAIGSEFVVWEDPVPVGIEHQGGAVHFGPDGKLYIATGDQQSSANAQDGANFRGKILRLAGDGTVPLDNPFVGVAGWRPEIWAYGLRNPFRFRFDAATGRGWIGDVGGNGPMAWEELDLLDRGANYGWPLAEGPVCHTTDCSAMRTSRFHFRHDDLRYTSGSPESALIVGPVYRGASFPPEYHGNLFLLDFVAGWHTRLRFDGAGNVIEEIPFELAGDAGGIVDLDVGPDGALYTSCRAKNEVWRIRWIGAANVPPIVHAGAAPAAGPPPLAVQFTGSASVDLDQSPQPLYYFWDFGDGTTSALADPQHTYTTRGVFQASLRVSDGAESTTGIVTVEVGHRPVISNLTPPAGLLYRAGDTIPFSATATDVEDGALPPAAFTWRVLLVHETHEHPFLGPFTGGGGAFTVPTTGHGPEHTHFVVAVEARDSDGLVASTRVEVHPRTVPLLVRASPTGISLLLDGQPGATPIAYTSVEGFTHALEAPETAVVQGQPWVFDLWSTGESTRQIAWTAPAAGGNVRAFYRPDDRSVVTVSVPAADRNAAWRPSTGQTPADLYDAQALCFGGGGMETALEFALPVPHGAWIESALLELEGATDQAGLPAVSIRAYATGDALPFAFGSPVALSLHARFLPAAVAWSPPMFGEDHVVRSPEIAHLLQTLVRRPDWAAGQHVGFLLHAPGAAPGELRCVRNWSSGQPARLRVVWRPDPGPGSLPPHPR